MATVHFVHAPDGWAHHGDEQDHRQTRFGTWLRQAREARGITLDHITSETKIPLRHLEALEHGNLGVVPAFYQRAEVRAVARAVGVDEWVALDRLDAAIAPASERDEARAPRPALKWRLPAAAVALGILAIAAAMAGRAALDGMSVPQREAAPLTAVGSELPAVTLVQDELPAATPAVSATVAAPDVTPPTESFSELVVRTEPPGAQVTVNGIGWGVSPVTIRHLPPGDKYIRATKDGFAATERMLALEGGQRRTLDLPLATAE